MALTDAACRNAALGKCPAMGRLTIALIRKHPASRDRVSIELLPNGGCFQKKAGFTHSTR